MNGDDPCCRIRSPLFRLRFPVSEIAHWASRYADAESEVEKRIIEEIAPGVRRRGYYTRDEFLTVCRWKSPRPVPRYSRNGERLIRDVTAAAIRSQNEIGIGTMCVLEGVGWPVASALLHFVVEDCPILDVRALWSLSLCPPAGYRFNFWRAYRRYCRLMARTAGVDMRTLDRALWQFSKEQQPKTDRLPPPFDGSDKFGIAPEGDARTRLWLRPNRLLVGFEQNLWYALTIDGYHHIVSAWGIHDATGKEAWDRMAGFESANGRWRGSFADLRCCLFKLQRSIRWIEQSSHAPELRRMYDRCYLAVCNAWDDEHADHAAMVRLASR